MFLYKDDIPETLVDMLGTIIESSCKDQSPCCNADLQIDAQLICSDNSPIEEILRNKKSFAVDIQIYCAKCGKDFSHEDLALDGKSKSNIIMGVRVPAEQKTPAVKMLTEEELIGKEIPIEC